MQAGSTIKRIGLNAISLWLAKLSYLALGVILTPVLLWELGKDGYGLCAIAMTVNSLAMVADMGIRVALARQLTASLSKRHYQQASSLASTGMVVYVVLGATMAGACFAAAPRLATWFRVSEPLLADAIQLIRWYGGLSILLSFIQPVYSAALTARNRFDLINYTDLILGIARGIAVLTAVILSERNLLAWAATMLFFQAAAVFVHRQLVRIAVPELEIRARLADVKLFGSVLSLGGALFLLRLSKTLGQTLDPIILTSFLGPGAVALYRPAQSLVRVASPLVSMLREQLLPLATAAFVENRRDRLQRLLVDGTRYTVLLGVPVYVVLFVFAESIIQVWLGRSLGAEIAVTANVLKCLAVVQLFMCLGGTQWPVLLGANSIGFVVKLQLPLAAINLIVSYVLVGFTSLGVFGVVVATAAFAILQRPILAIHTAHLAGLSARDYFRRAYWRPLLVLLLVATVAWGFRTILGLDTITELLCATAATGLSWLALTWFVGLKQTDRAMFRQLAAEARTKLFRTRKLAPLEKPSTH